MTGSLQGNVGLMLEFTTAKVGTWDVITTEALGKEGKTTFSSCSSEPGTT